MFDLDAEMIGGLGQLFANAEAEETMGLRALGDRQAKLCARLAKFDAASTIQQIAGQLTAPENHAATLRLEALIHLAALHCRGRQTPTLVQLREWINDIMAADPLARGEDPVEDVFVSLVPSRSGGIRIFEGVWEDSGQFLHDAVAALMLMPSAPWIATTLQQVNGLLTLSEAVADRVDAARYTMSTGQPRVPLTISTRTVPHRAEAVRFTLAEVLALGTLGGDLIPFIFDLQAAEGLLDETLGHTALERRPLVRAGTDWIVALPTAISAAARRHILEAAAAAGAAPAFDEALLEAQKRDLISIGFPGWRLKSAGPPIPLGPGIEAYPAEFDLGGAALVVLISDTLEAVLETGLQGMAYFPAGLEASIEAIEQARAAEPGYRRGLTVLVRGGLGRGLALGLGEAPDEWSRAVVNLGDALRLGYDHDFSGVRVWKIERQQSELRDRGFEVVNMNGFLNLYGFRRQLEFAPTPANATPPTLIMLAANYIASMRQRLRQTLDYHLLLGPERRTWIEVQRRATDAFFKEASDLPLYVTPVELMRDRRLLACTETVRRPWWIDIDGHIESEVGGPLVHRIFDALQNWSVRLAPRLEADLETLPEGPVWLRFSFPGIEAWTEDAAFAEAPIERPDWRVAEGCVHISCSNAMLRAFAEPTSIAERWLCAAVAAGTAQLADAVRTQAWADDMAAAVVRGDEARFVHVIPTTDITQMLQAAIPLPRLRFAADEDLGWARLGLAGFAGRNQDGPVPTGEIVPLLHAAVLALWERIRARLDTIDRRSLVLAAVRNHEAIDKDRAEWKHTAAALLAIYDDQGDVIRTHNDLENRRAMAGMASRALAEMAICTSPTTGGAPCGRIDLDLLIADVVIMLDCAGQCDAYHYGLSEGPLVVTGNGAFEFDLGFLRALHLPYLYAQGERAFRDAADDYADAFEKRVGSDATPAPAIDPEFEAAVLAEFGVGLEDLVALEWEMAEAALTSGSPFLSMRKSELLARVSDGERAARVDQDRLYQSLVLQPRPVWNEDKPQGALAKDWHPWRVNRKLSLMRRPLIQIDESDDPEVLIFPALLARTVRRAFQLIDGRLPSTMFDTRAVDRWLGKVVDERGHAFNIRVRDALRGLGYQAESDVLMTRLGGDKAMGDVDVMAWSPGTGEVWAIECKRLLIDRTVGEIGERLADYTTPGKRNGKRTLIQKHLDRLDRLREHPDALARFVGLPSAEMVVKAALVTDALVPMQFTGRMLDLVDRACDFRSLADAFAIAPAGD